MVGVGAAGLLLASAALATTLFTGDAAPAGRVPTRAAALRVGGVRWCEPSGWRSGRAADLAVDSLLSTMSVRARVAQLVMPWIPGGLAPHERAMHEAEQLARAAGVGGFIVGRGDAAATRSAIERLQRAAAVPLLIGSDLEWGPGMRLTGTTVFPGNMALGATRDTALAYAQACATAREALAAGITMAFAPVADVNVDPRNPIINTRSYGEDPRLVAAMTRATVRGLQDGGMIAVVKHFPGHGDTHTDSHVALPVVRASRARLDSVELRPFRAALRAGVGGVMTAHVALPAITGRANVPATLSSRVVAGLLRGELGFDGLVVTDALNMAGVEVSTPGEVAVRAVAAGADVLLQPPGTEQVIDALVRAVRAGRISPARLDSSVRRVLRAKARVSAGAPPHALPSDSARRAFDSLAHVIARRSITLVRDRADLLPLRPDSEPILSVVFAERGTPAPGVEFARVLRANGRHVRQMVVARSDAARLRAVEEAVRGARGAVVISTYAHAAPGAGRVGVPAAVRATIRRVAAERPLVYIAFGDPYVAGEMATPAAVLLAWSDAAVAQRAAARALTGAAPITGRLPVSLPPGYKFGWGMARGVPDADTAAWTP